MLDELRTLCAGLLRDGTVQVVIGYGLDPDGVSVYPVFLTSPDEVNCLVWNSDCQPNLVTYLLRPDVRALGRPAVIVKACDERALVVLQRENQLRSDDVYVIGVTCDDTHAPRLTKCGSCDTRTPRFANSLVGRPAPDSDATPERYGDLAAFLQRSPEERMAYWREQLQRCTKCYACRQVCPLCYCRQCIVDKNQPVCLETSPTLKGNFAWHITRAFHLAGRCVGCDECTRACPAGIDLRLLNLSLSRAAEEQFGYRAGDQPEAAPVFGAFSEQDQESFIR